MSQTLATTPIAPPPQERSRQMGWLRRGLGVGSVYLFVIALLATGRLVSADFLSAGNLMQIVKNVSILGIVAVGVAFITYSGHYLDMAIPMIMAIAGIVAAYALPYGFAAGFLAGLAAGCVLGALNGVMVGYLRLNPILWTLAAMSVLDGATRWAYGGQYIYADTATPAGALFNKLYTGEVAYVPMPVVLFIIVAVAGHVMLRHTGYGQRLKLTGSAYEVARLSGVHVRRTVMLAFVASGAAAALAGMVKTALMGKGDVETGLTYDFQAVTAVVLGGVTLAGGRGSMLGVVGGVLVIGLLGAILPLVQFSHFPTFKIGKDDELIIRGVIFIAVVGINMYSLRKAGRDDA